MSATQDAARPDAHADADAAVVRSRPAWARWRPPSMRRRAPSLTARVLRGVLLPLALLHNGLPPAAPAQVWLAISLLGLVCTGLAYVLFFRILGRAGATNISLVTFLVPVSAILLGWLFLDEVLGLPQVLGMAVIGLGLAMIDGRLLRR